MELTFEFFDRIKLNYEYNASLMIYFQMHRYHLRRKAKRAAKKKKAEEAGKKKGKWGKTSKGALSKTATPAQLKPATKVVAPAAKKDDAKDKGETPKPESGKALDLGGTQGTALNDSNTSVLN